MQPFRRMYLEEQDIHSLTPSHRALKAPSRGDRIDWMDWINWIDRLDRLDHQLDQSDHRLDH